MVLFMFSTSNFDAPYLSTFFCSSSIAISQSCSDFGGLKHSLNTIFDEFGSQSFVDAIADRKLELISLSLKSGISQPYLRKES